MIEKISKGISFKGFSSNIGGLILIAGIVWLLAGNHKLLAIITIIVGFIVFLAIKGVLIDYDKEKIKAYTDLLLFKFGKWETLNDYNKNCSQVLKRITNHEYGKHQPYLYD